MLNDCLKYSYIISSYHILFPSLKTTRIQYTRIEYKQDGGGITEGWKPEVGLYHLYKDQRTQYQTNRKQNKNRTCKK